MTAATTTSTNTTRKRAAPEQLSLEDLQKDAENAVYDALLEREGDPVMMRRLLRRLDANTTKPVLGMRVSTGEGRPEMSLLAAAFYYNQYSVAMLILQFLEDATVFAGDKEAELDALRECLRGSSAGRSIMQQIAEKLSNGVLVTDEEVPAVNLLHAAYSRLADAAGEAVLDRFTVADPFARIYGEITHPGPPTDPAVQMDEFPPRVSIVLHAHSLDMVDDDDDDPAAAAWNNTTTRPPPPGKLYDDDTGLKRGDIAVLFHGPGVCGMSTLVNRESSVLFERAVWAATRPHRSNTMATMRHLQKSLRGHYKAKMLETHAANKDDAATAILEANEHNRIVNPYLDRSYTFKPRGVLRVVQSFNSPFNDLVGQALFGPEMRRRMRALLPEQAEALKSVNEMLASGAITYRGSIRELNLSAIAKTVKLMGYDALNVYDYCCRDLYFAATRKKTIIAPMDKAQRRQDVARFVSEKEMQVVDRAYGGGGGGKRRRRRRRRSAAVRGTSNKYRRVGAGTRRAPR